MNLSQHFIYHLFVIGFSLSSNEQLSDKHTIIFPAEICRTTYLFGRLPFSCLKHVRCPVRVKNNSEMLTPALSAILLESVFAFSQAGSSSSSSWPFTVLVQTDVHTKIYLYGLCVNIYARVCLRAHEHTDILSGSLTHTLGLGRTDVCMSHPSPITSAATLQLGRLSAVFLPFPPRSFLCLFSPSLSFFCSLAL